MPKVVLVNDTSLYATHFGCQLVGQTLREQFARTGLTGLTLIAAFPRELDMQVAQPYLDAADLVIINAEGTLHHGQHLELLKLARTWPCALINGVFQDSGQQPDLANFQYESSRGLAKAAEESDYDHDRSDKDTLAESLANGNFLLRFHGVLLS